MWWHARPRSCSSGPSCRPARPNAAAAEIFARHRATVHVPRRFYVEVLPGIPTIRVFEALACGTPVAAFPVTGPKDVISDHPIGAIDHDLRSACLRALNMSRADCRNFALERSWENSARQFIGNLATLQPSRAPRPARRVAGRSAVPN